MNKSKCYLFLALITIVLFSSCTIPRTHRLVIDEYSPPEQNATITFKSHTERGWFILREWNNIEIREDLYIKTKGTIRSKDKAVFTIPAGNHTFLFDMRITFSNQYSTTTYRFDNLRVQFAFEAGKEYEIRSRTRSLGLFRGSEVLLGVYDITGRSERVQEWKLGEI